LTEDHGAVANCKYTLAYSADGTGTTGTDLTDSDIYTNEAFDCDGSTVTIDTQGQSCMRRTAPLLLTEGAWAHWKIADGGDSGDCDETFTYVEVYGEQRRNG
jgi:hypothetical protein